MLQELAFTGQWRHIKKIAFSIRVTLYGGWPLPSLVAGSGSGKQPWESNLSDASASQPGSWLQRSPFVNNGSTGLSRHS